MTTPRTILLLSALLFAGCATDPIHSTRYQWHDRARYLAEESRQLSIDVRDHLVDCDRWEPRGRDLELWDTTLRIRTETNEMARKFANADAHPSHYYYGDSNYHPDDNVDAAYYADTIRRLRERVGYVHRYLKTDNVSRDVMTRLAGIDAILWTMQNEGYGDQTSHGTRYTGKPHPESKVFTYRQPVYRVPEQAYHTSGAGARGTHDYEDYVRYSEPYVGAIRADSRDDAARSVRSTRGATTGVATHAGQSEEIRAHSAARRYVTMHYGVTNRNLETSSVLKKGDRYVVTLNSSSQRYVVTVNGSDGSVLGDKISGR